MPNKILCLLLLRGKVILTFRSGLGVVIKLIIIINTALRIDKMAAKCKNSTWETIDGLVSSPPLPQDGAGYVKSKTARIIPTIKLNINPQNAP